ncbi:unnamed protein product [Amoebophrya sp. A25]|nr:unnamed protein product [Amoebophrya sp. A25]|eukprot:GSA25T00019295001.1
MLLFPSLLRWHQNVSGLQCRREERRVGVLLRAGPSALRSCAAVALLSSAFSVTPLHIGLYAAAKQTEHSRDDQAPPRERKPPDINDATELTDTDRPEGEDPHKAASFVVISTGEAERVAETATGDHIDQQIAEVDQMIAQIRQMSTVGVDAQGETEGGGLNGMKTKLEMLRTQVEQLPRVLQTMLSEVNSENYNSRVLQAESSEPVQAYGDAIDELKRSITIIESRLEEVEREAVESKQLVEPSQVKKHEDLASGSGNHISVSTRSSGVEMSGRLSQMEKLQEQRQQQREEMQNLVDKQTQQTKELEASLQVALQAVAPEELQNKLSTHSSTSPSVEVSIVSGLPRPPAFLDWKSSKVEAQSLTVNVQMRSSVPDPFRKYVIKIEVPVPSKEKQSSEPAWSLTEQLALFKNDAIMVKLCRYRYTGHENDDTLGNFGVAKWADFQKQIRGGELGQPFRYVRVSGFSQFEPAGTLSYGGINDAAVTGLANLLKSAKQMYEYDFHVVCETESATWPFGSKPYEEYSRISVKFMWVEVSVVPETVI